MNNRLDVKENKYKNKKVECDDRTFDSKKERDYYLTLKSLERLGIIKDIELQVKFELQPSFMYHGETIRTINYIADFVYTDAKTGNKIVVDVKGYRTKEYKIKKKLFLYKYKEVIFEEV